MSTSGIDRWIDRLKKAEKTSLIQDGKRKVHYTFDDKTEMAEDYNIQSGELLVRKWRKKSTLGASLPWEYEVGQGIESLDGGRAAMMDKLDFQESSNNPIFVRLDTLSSFQWRIRNMTWPSDNYIVELDESETSIVIKTKNKKYYKKFIIPDLERIGMRRLEKRNLNYTHSNNTLIINYLKPDEILHMEKLIKNELSKLKSNKDGEVECKPS